MTESTNRRWLAVLSAALLATTSLVLSAPDAGGSATPAPAADKPVLSSGLRGLQSSGATTRGAHRRGAEPSELDRGLAQVERRADGAPLVLIRAEDERVTDVVADLVAIESVDVVNVTGVFVTAHVPVAGLDEAAGVPGVRSVTEALAPVTRCGAVVSEGDSVMEADDARADFGVDGTGVTVGVLSDSFDQSPTASTNAAQDVASGDLPGPGSPCGSQTAVSVNTACSLPSMCSNPIDEGRAMAQIVHDLAPGADITFGSAFNGFFQFAAEIRDLAADGADVLVDDIGYFAEPFFQQGPIGDAITDVVDDGVSYHSALGNDRVLGPGGTDQTAYESPAVRAAACAPAALDGALCHDFDPGAGVDTTWRYTVPANGRLTINMQWSEPWVGVDTDLDIYAFDLSGTPVAGSDDDNVNGGAPFEVLDFVAGPTAKTIDIAVVRFSGATPRFRMTHLRSNFSASEYTTVSAPDTLGGGFAYGHPATEDAIGVGAVPFNDPTRPESFSSRGPATHYWGPTGDLTGPAAAIAPKVIAKPDVAGIDGGLTTFFGGGNRFYGTSAAAPHVAAVAALMREVNPLLTPEQIRSILQDTANPLANGDATQWGAGLVDARDAVSAAAALGAQRTRFVPLVPARLLDTRNGTGYAGPKPGAGATVDFQVTGEGGVPDEAEVRAVVLTVVATQATRAGFVTAHPSGTPLPLASNLNLDRTGQTIANQVVVAVPPSGRVSLYTDRGTHLVADVVGYYRAEDGAVSAGRFKTLVPERLLDTRNGTGYVGSKPADDTSVELTVGGVGGVPSGAVAVILNVAATETTGAGFVTVHPDGVARPTASSLNIERSGQTIGSHVTVRLSPAGKVRLYAIKSTHLVADVVGYYSAETEPASTEGLFIPTAPTRLLDTRFGNGYPSGTKPAASETFTVEFAGRGSLPEGGMGAVALNLTIVGTSAAGYVTPYPAGATQPLASSLNTDARGQTRPNLVTSGVSPDGEMNVFTLRSAHFVADVVGYFVEEPL